MSGAFRINFHGSVTFLCELILKAPLIHVIYKFHDKPIGLVQRSAATLRGGLHSSPRALVTIVGLCYRTLEIVGVIIIINLIDNT